MPSCGGELEDAGWICPVGLAKLEEAPVPEGWRASDVVSTAAFDAVLVKIAPADLAYGRCVGTPKWPRRGYSMTWYKISLNDSEEAPARRGTPMPVGIACPKVALAKYEYEGLEHGFLGSLFLRVH